MNKTTGRKKANFAGYALSYIDSSVKATIKKKSFDAAALFEWVSKQVDDGYKFALQWSERDQAYVASLFASYADMANAGLMLAARHLDPEIAVLALIVLHDEVYPEGWDVQDSHDW